MSTSIIIALIGIIPSTIAAVLAHSINQKADARDKELKQQAEERAEASRIQMEMITAGASLSYACAMALKRGQPNGEVEEAVAEYTIAKKNYLEYINKGYFEYREGVK
jgi:hypothetical protein